MSSKSEFSAEEMAVLRPIFLGSAREHLASIDQTTGAMSEAGAVNEALDALHRSIHSLKGAALQIGFLHVGQTARLLEQVVLRARTEGSQAPSGWLALVRRSVPALTGLLDALENDEAREPDPNLVLALEAWLANGGEEHGVRRAG